MLPIQTAYSASVQPTQAQTSQKHRLDKAATSTTQLLLDTWLLDSLCQGVARSFGCSFDRLLASVTFAVSQVHFTMIKLMRRKSYTLRLLMVVVFGVWTLFCSRPVYKKQSSMSAFSPHMYRHGPSELDCNPQRIHLAPRSNMYSTVSGDSLVNMTMSFSLDYEKCRDVQPVVFYGQGSHAHKIIVQDAPLQFNYTSEVSNGEYHSDWIYHIEIPHVKAGLEEYWYKIQVHGKGAVQSQLDPLEIVSHDANNYASRGLHYKQDWQPGSLVGTMDLEFDFTFRTPPLPGTPTTLALIGDLGQTYNSTMTMLHIYKNAIDIPVENNPVSNLLIVGDLSYADTDPDRWTSWFALMSPLLQRLPMAVVAGNHEIECDAINRIIFQAFENWFYNPNRIGPAEIEPISEEYKETLWHHSCATPSEFGGHYNYGNAFYSYQHGLATIIVLSSYSDATVGSVQYKWFEETLQAYDRKTTPWLIVAFHSPIYTTFIGHYKEAEEERMRIAMEPLFIQYGANIVISGHDHAYMRTVPMANNHIDPTGKAPIYLILGTGGNREHHSKYRNLAPEEWVAMRTHTDYGYGKLFMANASHARFHWIRDNLEDYGIHDDVWFVNPHINDDDAAATTAQ
jgi:acid phosphatase type 7